MENAMNGFDDFDTQVTAEEFYAGWTEDEADYMANLCTMCRTHEAVEDGFCSFQCENLFHDQVKATEGVSDQMYDDRYEDHMAQYDNEPDIYAGTYSEE
jgi:hypothetical protein